MARTVRDAALESRTARARLKANPKPYWRAIETGLHLGYRKGKKGGVWVLRRRAGGAKVYEVEKIATADDVLDPDGAVILSFPQAQAIARQRFVEARRAAEGLPAQSSGPYLVKDAMQSYVAWLAEQRKSAREIQWTAEASILPLLGDRPVAKLKTEELRKWLEAQAKEPARLRTRKGKPQRYRQVDPDDAEEAKRRRQSTANHKLVVLKAALNMAHNDHKVPSDAAWRAVKPFRGVDGARMRYLTTAECVRLLNACEPDLRKLVQGGLLTGCRYAKLAGLVASDFDPDSGTLTIRGGKPGKVQHIVLTDEGIEFFRAICAGKAAADRLFVKDDGSRWRKSHQFRPIKEAVARAKIEPGVSFHTLRHTWASLGVMAGMPLMVVARNLGHTDTRMVERHYGHLAPGYVKDTVKALAPRFGIKADGNVKAIGGNA